MKRAPRARQGTRVLTALGALSAFEGAVVSGRGREFADLRRHRDRGVQLEPDGVAAVAVALVLHVAHRRRGHVARQSPSVDRVGVLVAASEAGGEAAVGAGDESDGGGRDDQTGFVGHDGVLQVFSTGVALT